jgi:hypothetical protein
MYARGAPFFALGHLSKGDSSVGEAKKRVSVNARAHLLKLKLKLVIDIIGTIFVHFTLGTVLLCL